MWQELSKLFWQNLTKISPPVFWAILVLFLGWFISKWIGSLTASFLIKIRLAQALKRMGSEEILSKIDAKLSAPRFFGEIVRWFFVILFLMLASEILGLSQFSQFLEKVIAYYPNIFIAALIFVVAVFLSAFSQKIMLATLEKGKITYSRLVGKSISWLIWLFATLAILYQLKITPSLILAIFIGMIATISLALGIAFGLGGKDLAAKILKELEEKFK